MGKILQLCGINVTIQYEMNKKINAYAIIHAMENQLQIFSFKNLYLFSLEWYCIVLY